MCDDTTARRTGESNERIRDCACTQQNTETSSQTRASPHSNEQKTTTAERAKRHAMEVDEATNAPCWPGLPMLMLSLPTEAPAMTSIWEVLLCHEKRTHRTQSTNRVRPPAMTMVHGSRPERHTSTRHLAVEKTTIRDSQSTGHRLEQRGNVSRSVLLAGGGAQLL
jgi:hypothetical protein